MTEKTSVTGRDAYVMAQALAYAIAFIDRLPEERQERSNRDDMVALLDTMVPDPARREEFAHAVEVHTGVLPDLTDWKVGAPPEWTPGQRGG